jgi:methylamine--corrinoid protein Co-methyltransferase
LGIVRNDADIFWPEFGLCGLRPYDSHEYSQLNECKIDIDFIRECQHIRDYGAVAMTEQMPIVGGFLPSVEAAAVSNVATHLAAFAMFGASYHLDGPIHVRWGTTTAKETCQCAGHAALALDRNTQLLLANQYYTLAGPATKMVFLEAACQSITDTASGRELLSGVASAKGVAEDYTTGMEARANGEIAMATCKLNVPKANEVLNAVLATHVKDYKVAPKGKKYHECYDPVKILPTEENLKAYEEAMKTLEACGLPLSGIW